MTIAVDLGRKATKPTNQLLKEQSGQFLHCLLRQGKVGKIMCVKDRLEVANIVNPDQIALKDNLICVYNICHLNTTFKTPCGD